MTRTLGLTLAVLCCACKPEDAVRSGEPGGGSGAPPDSDAPCVASTWYADRDADGWGDVARATRACDAPAGHVADASDCDDDDPSVHPGTVDGDCDDLDDDCDGLLDEDAASAAWRDGDGDGFGDPDAVSATTCVLPLGYVRDGSDCDDADAAVFPGAPEPDCDGLDNDCDGDIGSAALLDGVGYPTVKAAVRAADPGATVEVCDGVHHESLLILESLTLKGRSGDPTRAILDGEGRYGLLQVEAEAFELADVTLRNGASSSLVHGGGAIVAWDARVALRRVIVDDHVSILGGGAVHVLAAGAPASLTIEDCTFEGNDAGGSGGAILLESDFADVAATLHIQRSTFTSNAAPDGGAVSVTGKYDVSTRIEDTMFDGNEARGCGGALDVGGSGDHTVSIEGSSFSRNLVDSAGGAVTVGGRGTSDVTVATSVFESNEAYNAAALDFGGRGSVNVAITDSVFRENVASNAGGAIGAGGWSAHTLAIARTSFDGNAATAVGGALHFTGNAGIAVSLMDSTLTGNVADEGCAMSLAANDGFDISFDETIVDANMCPDGAYAIFVKSSADDLPGQLEFLGGAVTGHPGGLFVRSRVVEVRSEGADWGSGITDNDVDVAYPPFAVSTYAVDDFTCDWRAGCVP